MVPLSVPKAQYEPSTQLSDVAYLSILPAEESVSVVGFPAPLQGPEIAENFSLKLSSRCSGF